MIIRYAFFKSRTPLSGIFYENYTVNETNKWEKSIKS